MLNSKTDLENAITLAKVDMVLQEFVPGYEFSVFYYRFPNEDRGRIFSITEKRMPSVVGDGISTLEKLILEDDRTVCMARLLLKQHQSRASHVPALGERVRLVELGPGRGIPGEEHQADADHDGLPDAWEVQFGFNPNDATDAARDADGDTEHHCDGVGRGPARQARR